MSELCLLTAQLVADALTSPKALKLPAVDSYQSQPVMAETTQTLESKPVMSPAVPSTVTSPRFSRTLAPSPADLANASSAMNNEVKPDKSSEVVTSPILPTMAARSSLRPELPLVNPTQREHDLALLAAIRQRVSASTTPTPTVSRIQSGLQNRVLQTIPAFSGPRPQSGSQLYQQRLAALQSGRLYTRLSPDSFQAQWQDVSHQPTYEQWRNLLNQEASAMAAGQGQNRLTVILGDSISLWLPPEWLPRDRFWLNQGISGDTTTGILQRLPTIAQTRPDTIHLMAGINDLKNGASDTTVLNNLRTIVQQLRQTHPQARVIVHSILPTRLPSLPSQRISALNQQIAAISQQEGSFFLDLQPNFADGRGELRHELTTDGLHLNPSGYRLWQVAMLSI